MSEHLPEHFSEDATGIMYREPSSAKATLLLGMFAAIFVLVPPFVVGFPIGLLFVGFGLLLVALAVASARPQSLRFDSATRRVHGRRRGKFWFPSSIDAEFDLLGQPEIRRQTREMDSDLLEIQVTLKGQSPLCVGVFEDPTIAEHWRSRLHALVKSGE